MRAPIRLALPILAMLLTPITSGCLITDPIDIPEQENFPPSIVSDLAAPEPRYPIEEIVTLDRDVDTSLTFAVRIRDANVEQQLDYGVYYNFEPGGALTLLESGTIPATGSLERPLDFTLNDLTRYTRGQCHKIDLRVSGNLEPDGFPPDQDPEAEPEPLDLDVAVWWINSLSDDGTPTDLATCPD